ncbi:MAG: Ig-like domain-containing protein, partial [Longimicrobiaceae bacterium]
MNRIPSWRAAFLAALLSCLLLPAVFLAQGTGPKALVVCPPTDAAGCDRIASQLALTMNGGTPVFPGGVDKKYTELRTMSLSQLQSYSAVFVPSLANAPYSLLRETAVRYRLSQILRGRVAVWSGTPDRGVTTDASAGKLTLIQSLGRWAAAQHAADGSAGLVVLQDFSDALPDGSSPRYDWIQGIAGVSVAPVTTVRTYAQVEKNNANSAAAAIVGSLAYDNMASFGLAAPPNPGLVGAWGQTVNGKKLNRGDVVLATFVRTPPTSFTMTPTGGTINAQGGKVVLVFPAGAVAEPVSITVSKATVSETNYVPETAYSFDPSMTFASPVSLTISYLESNIPGGIANEPKLVICEFKASAWTVVPGSTVNAAANTVTAPIDHFSRYAIFVEGGACGGDGGGGGGGGKPVGSVVVTPATASVVAGQSQTLTATVKDKNGGALSGRTVTWSSTNGGSFSTTTSTTNSSGQATTQFTVGTVAGTQHVVTAAVDNKSGTSTLTVIAGSAAKLGFKVQPSNTGAGAAITPAVQVAIQDAFGNTVTGATDNVTLAIGTNPSGGALSGTAT